MHTAMPVRQSASHLRHDVIVLAAALGLALATLVVLTADGVRHVVGEYGLPEYSHGWLVPAVALFIAWQRRHHVMTAATPGGWAGPMLMLAAVLLALLGAVTSFHRVQAVALPLALGGIGLATVGRGGMRPLWMPLAFLFFAIPLPGAAYTPLSLWLQLVSSELGAGILRLLGVSVYLDGNIIDLGVARLQVLEACNGLRYFFPLTAVGFLCAWLYRAPLWAKLVVFLSVGPITVALNSARIAISGLLFEHGLGQYAEGFMHLFEGWIIFLVALALLLLEMWFLLRLAGRPCRWVDVLDFDRIQGEERPRPSRAGAARVSGTLALRSSPALLAAVGLLTCAALGQAALSARVEIAPARPGLATFPTRLDAWEGRQLAIDDATLRALDGADDYLLADYSEPGTGRPINLWVAYYSSQRGSATIHTPDACLPGSGWQLGGFEQVPAPGPAASGPSFLLNRGIATRGAERMLVYYWLEQRGRQFTSNGPVKWFVIWDLLAKGRTDGAIVRLATPMPPGETVDEAERRLVPFFARAYPALQPHIGL